MKTLSTLLSVILLVLRCHENKENIEFEFFNKNQEEQVYSLINDFIIDSIEKPDLVSIEAMPFCDTTYDENNPPPPPGHFYCYSQTLFDTLLKAQIIDSLDLAFIIKQKKQLKQLFWNPDSIKTRVINTHELLELYKTNKLFDIYDYIYEKYSARNFIKLSTPLFSRDGNVIIISIASFCGWTCGGGIIYVFKLNNGSWEIQYSKQLWIS